MVQKNILLLYTNNYDNTISLQNRELMYGKFRALQVQVDNVRMSDFITKEIGSFERGKAFYEFKAGDKEDLLCCRKAIRIPGKKVLQLLFC